MLCNKHSQFSKQFLWSLFFPLFYLRCFLQFYNSCSLCVVLWNVHTTSFLTEAERVLSPTGKAEARLALLPHLYLKEEPLLKRAPLALGFGWSESLKKAWYSTHVFQKFLHASLLPSTNSRVSWYGPWEQKTKVRVTTSRMKFRKAKGYSKVKD